MIDKERIETMASEIVRGMTNGQLSKDQQDMLQYVSKCVMTNYLVYKMEEEEIAEMNKKLEGTK